MTRSTILLATLLATTATPVFAGDFTATVDSNQVEAGEGFTLHLSLRNAQARGEPDLSALSEAFSVESEGHSSDTTIINGNVSSSVGWDVLLLPKVEGKIVIPPVSLNTSEGTLSTDALAVNVSHTAATAQPRASRNVTITARASTRAPYKDQPILYTVDIAARGELTDLSLGELNMDNAVIQKQGEPSIRDAVENSEPVKLVEVRYTITPLAAGHLIIPPMVLHGKMLESQPNQRNADPFGQGFADPFAMMRGMNMRGFGGFGELKPFSVASNNVTLDVKPQAVAMDPWLPLSSLTVREEWSNPPARVGEPLTRKLTLSATGGTAKQLPSLEAQQNHDDFNVYADKPVISERSTGNDIGGTRVESFSLIPKKPGKLELPAIRVPWWNIRTNAIDYAQLPAREIDVLPAAGATTPPVAAAPTPKAEAPLPASQAATHEAAPMSYGIIAVLALALALAAGWGIHLRHRLARLAAARIPADQPPVVEPQPQPSGTTGKDLANARTVVELADELRRIAHERFGARRNASIEEAVSAIAQGESGGELAGRIAATLSAGLYAGKHVDLADIKNMCSALLDHSRRVRGMPDASSEKLPKLNPD